jgi:RimJ/RimL family protein N-acetyltransferase
VTAAFRLLPCRPDGFPEAPHPELPDFIRQACGQNQRWYEQVGWQAPWHGYVAVADGLAVGGGGFKEPPKDGRIEIAYFTVPACERRGYATRTARELIAIARRTDPALAIAAQTLPEENASTAILRKLGFRLDGPIVHPEDGVIWEWRL